MTQDSGADPFALEQIFPTPLSALRSRRLVRADSNETLIALDPNSLLLPYEIGAGNLRALGEVYHKLSAENVSSFQAEPSASLSSITTGGLLTCCARFANERRVASGQSTSTASSGDCGRQENSRCVQGARRSSKRLRRGDGRIGRRDRWLGKWRPGRRPVREFVQGWGRRYRLRWKREINARMGVASNEQSATGYKDAAKEVSIGDFLIWKTLLTLGEKEKKNCAFVTGDQKADWFVRVDGKGTLRQARTRRRIRAFFGRQRLAAHEPSRTA